MPGRPGSIRVADFAPLLFAQAKEVGAQVFVQLLGGEFVQLLFQLVVGHSPQVGEGARTARRKAGRALFQHGQKGLLWIHT